MNSPDLRKSVDGVTSNGAAPVAPQDLASKDTTDESPRFEVAGIRCRLLPVGDVVPRHSATRQHSRTRLIYVEGEIAHFDLCGHRYVLVADPPSTDHEALPGIEAGAPPANVHAFLTNRELQIVQLICMGCLTKQVADRLRISEFTVRSYLKTIYCKLGVRSRGAMVYRYAQAFRQTPE
jgi:DNA-binding CsgD family transcriptional regulator